MISRKHKAHVTHIIILNLVWLILSTDAAASDWFVRPAGGNYGSEDGSSYQDAWDGLSNVIWGPSGVEPGDTLYVCGLHLKSGNLDSYEFFTPGVAGTAGNVITIRGDYPGDQGIIWGAGIMAHEAWNYEGNNTWSITDVGAPNSGWYFEDITATRDSWTKLVKKDTLAECKVTAGSFYGEDYQQGSKFYVHCSDDGDPTNRIAANRLGYHVLAWRPYITWKNLEFYCLYRFIEVNDDEVHHNNWEGCTIWYGEVDAMLFRDGKHDLTMDDCDIAWASSTAISIQEYPTGSGNGPYNITIRNCKLHDIGVWVFGQDGHGIGINQGSDLLIEHNEVWNVASGIVDYEYRGGTGVTNLVIRYNIIHDTHTNGGTQRGICFNGDGDCATTRSGNQCYGNIVYNVSDGYRTTWGGSNAPLVFYNNVAYNCETSFWFNHITLAEGPNIKMRNNISLSPTLMHLYFGSDTSEGNYTIDSDNNLFYPDIAGGFDLKWMGGQHVQTNFSGWQSLSKTGCTFDTNSIVADPLLVDPVNGDFSLLPGSLAIDTGVDVGLTQDIEGNLIPRGSAPDIGAYESGNPNNPSPVLQAIGDKSVNENASLTFTINATDPDSEPITYSAQNLPSGATLDSQTGDFAWTPSYAQAGSYSVTFRASDGNSLDSETITITVSNINRAPVLGAISDPSVDENDLLNISVSATDPDGQALTYSVSGLPNGAAFASQTFTWTPSYDQAGTFAVTFTADDSEDQDSQVVTITVINVNRAPVFSAINNKSVWSDDPLTFTIDATDPDGDAVTYSANTVPSGATFITETFDWTPAAAQIGSYNVTFYASDGLLQDSEAITITVNVDSLAPTITNLSPAAGAIQVPLNNLITLNVTDAGKGVNASSVKIKFKTSSNPNNTDIYFGDLDHDISLLGDCRRIGNNADYKFVFQSTQDLLYNDQTITITVNAEDLAGNAMSEQYSFVTEMHLFGQNKLVNTNLDNNDKPVTVCDSNGNIWATWNTGSAGSRDIYIGTLASGADNFGNIIQLTTDANDQCNPALALDSNDKLYAVWQDNREGDWDIYISTSVDGINWATETRVNDPNNGNQVNPAIVIDSQSPSYAYVVWQDDRAGNQDICIAASNNGFITKTVSQITSDTSDQVDPAVAADSANTIYVVWMDSRNGSSDIYGAASNSGPWTNVAVISNVSNQSSPAIAAESTGTILHLLWVDDTPGNNDIYYSSSTNGFQGISGSSIIDDTSGADQVEPTIAITGTTSNDDLKVFAGWQDWRNTDTDLYFTELNAGSGTNVFVNDGGSNAYQGEPVIGIDEYGCSYIVWADDRSTNTDIYYAGSTFTEPVALASALVSASAPSSTVIGVDPGSITNVDDVSIVLPSGSCSYDVDISIVTILNQQVFSVPCLGSYDFGPSGVQFDQPVTITIPYVYSNSNGSMVPYWFNSLTGTVSQAGITNVQDIVISPTLHAISFQTTHFTPYYLLGGGGSGILGGGGGGGGGCSVSVGNEGNIVEFVLPYIVLIVVMAILKKRDARYRKVLRT